MHAQLLSRVWFFATPWTVARQAPLPLELSRQEYWSGLPLPTPGDLPDPGIEPTPLALAGGFFTTSATRLPKSQSCFEVQLKTLCRKPLQHEPFLHSKFTKHEFLLKLLKHAVTASSMPWHCPGTVCLTVSHARQGRDVISKTTEVPTVAAPTNGWAQAHWRPQSI